MTFGQEPSQPHPRIPNDLVEVAGRVPVSEVSDPSPEEHVDVLHDPQLQTALNSRVIIEQAKSVLAQRFGLSMDDAFDRLRSFSRDHNLRLAEGAARPWTAKSMLLHLSACRNHLGGPNRTDQRCARQPGANTDR